MYGPLLNYSFIKWSIGFLTNKRPFPFSPLPSDIYDVCVFSMTERCDQIIQCQDKSDEDNCSLLVFEESYNKLVAPFVLNPTDNSIIPVSIKVSTSLRNVLEISEFTHTIDLKLGISLEWYDNRILFHNLKNKDALNVLSISEV